MPLIWIIVGTIAAALAAPFLVPAAGPGLLAIAIIVLGVSGVISSIIWFFSITIGAKNWKKGQK